MPQLKITLPIRAVEQISKIVAENPVYNDHNDFIVYTITNALENYNRGRNE